MQRFLVWIIRVFSKLCNINLRLCKYLRGKLVITDDYSYFIGTSVAKNLGKILMPISKADLTTNLSA